MKAILSKYSNWKLILPIFLMFVVCIFLFQKYEKALSKLAGEKVQIIDMRSNYDVEEINEFFTKIKPEGIAIHKFTTAVVDMIFPVAYGCLFILLSAFFLKKITHPDSNWMYLSLLPVALMIFDYKENFNTLQLLESFPNLSAEKVDQAATITDIKSILTSVSMGLPLLLGCIWLVRRLFFKSRP